MLRKTNSILALSLCAALVPGAALAVDYNGGRLGVRPLDATVGSLLLNEGHIICSAAVNSTGVLVGGNHTNSATTFSLGTGEYQVGFGSICSNVTIANGFFRVVQPDTLTTGVTGPVFCTVADRAGVTSAIFVECFNNAGVFTNTSFTLSLSR